MDTTLEGHLISQEGVDHAMPGGLHLGGESIRSDDQPMHGFSDQSDGWVGRVIGLRCEQRNKADQHVGREAQRDGWVGKRPGRVVPT